MEELFRLYKLIFGEWHGWESLSAIILGVTAFFIYRQVRANEKQTRYSVMPNAFFIIKNNTFFIQNNSKFPIWFSVDLKLVAKDKNGKLVKEVPQLNYWRKPLFVFPGNFMPFPAVLRIEEFKNDPNFIAIDKIYAHIKYRYWPTFAPKEKSDDIVDDSWYQKFPEQQWIGPSGIEEENIKIR